MKHKKNRMPLSLLAWLFMAFAAFSQQSVDSLFQQGVSAFNRGNYAESLRILESLDKKHPEHALTTASLLIQGKALFQMGENQRAEEAFSEIIREYSKSSYADDARYGLAGVEYKRGRTNASLNLLFEVMDKSRDSRLAEKAGALASGVLDTSVRLEAFRDLARLARGEKSRSLLVPKWARAAAAAQDLPQARNAMESFIRDYPKNPSVPQMERMLLSLDRKGGLTARIGVILPLTGPLQEQGKDLLQGISYAVESFESNGLNVKLEVRDSQGRVLQAVRAAQDLCSDETVVALIGELESDITAAIAGVAQERGVPLLAPTASETGISGIGSNIFQMNCPIRLQAEKLAEYAFNGLGLRRFAVLYPADPYGQSMRDAFVEALQRMGGEMIAEKWYSGEAQDLNPQFKAIREKGIEKMLQDTTLIIVPKKALDFYKARGGGVEYVHQNVDAIVDSTQLAVTSIDGFFLPVYNADLPYIIPQFAHHNFKAKILGGAAWNDPELLQEQRQTIEPSYLDGAVFVSDFFVTNTNFRFQQFRDAFRKRYGTTPERMQIFGYDAANLILQAWDGISVDREAVRDALQRMSDYAGIRGPIRFSAERMNTHSYLLQYKSGYILDIR
ncbi:MAG: penicillin-binding protein activator [Acidobacteria bacterium]|nr:penicillin-binding protein activator [Acidobacteriota bacterium]